MGKVVASRSLKTAGSLSDHATVDSMCEQFYDFIGPYQTDEVLSNQAISFWIEDITTAGKMGKSAGRAEVIGVIKWNLRQQGFPVWGINPSDLWSWFKSQCRITVGRVASAQKKEITVNMLHKHFGIWEPNHNIADAHVAALFGEFITFKHGRWPHHPMFKR